jgi:hypothetical protein
MPRDVQFPGWTAPGPVLQLVCRTIEIGSSYRDEEQRTTLMVSLHAIERFLARAPPLLDLRPLHSILGIWAYTAERGYGSDFTVPEAGGHWRCALVSLDAGPAIIIVRTFVRDKPT